jgi:hypothetical protein
MTGIITGPREAQQQERTSKAYQESIKNQGNPSFTFAERFNKFRTDTRSQILQNERSDMLLNIKEIESQANQMQISFDILVEIRNLIYRNRGVDLDIDINRTLNSQVENFVSQANKSKIYDQKGNILKTPDPKIPFVGLQSYYIGPNNLPAHLVFTENIYQAPEMINMFKMFAEFPNKHPQEFAESQQDTMNYAIDFIKQKIMDLETFIQKSNAEVANKTQQIDQQGSKQSLPDTLTAAGNIKGAEEALNRANDVYKKVIQSATTRQR